MTTRWTHIKRWTLLVGTVAALAVPVSTASAETDGALLSRAAQLAQLGPGRGADGPLLTEAAAYFAARDDGSGDPVADVAAGSRPYLMARSCNQSPAVREACGVAIRYLRALDLDRFGTACALLARGTLENAGGMRGCSATMARARGIRIRYGIHEAVTTILGTSIRFRTRAVDGTGPGIDQTMIVRGEHGRQRIWAVMADPSPVAHDL